MSVVTKCTPEECRHIVKQSRLVSPVLEDENKLSMLALRFQALGNETRLRILGLLSVKDLCTCDIVESLGIAATTVAHHLRMLEDAGLITSQQVGRFTLYQLNNQLIEAHHIFA